MIRSARVDASVLQLEPDYYEFDPIIEAGNLRDAKEFEQARALLADLLERDLRCLDAHSQLGSEWFDNEPATALSHFEAGVRIGDLSFGEDFDGLLPWSLLNNRPFLSCLFGFALCSGVSVA